MRVLIVLFLLAGLAACADTPDETGSGPTVNVQFQDTSPPTSVNSEDGLLDAGDNCAYMNERAGTQQRVILSAGDSGGLDVVYLSIFPGRLTVDSFAPEAATVNVVDTPRGQRMEARIPAAPDGEVYVNALAQITVNVTPPVSAIRAGANDRDGNSSAIDQFDLRFREDEGGVICRGADRD